MARTQYPQLGVTLNSDERRAIEILAKRDSCSQASIVRRGALREIDARREEIEQYLRAQTTQAEAAA